ncbi:Nucleoside recognition domain protein [Maridesulfovibrio hydrothermalis]|uniref:Nucleoside recognition domain protein n=1 Tax=Maridesulfovibrio hydrothermalis AM13 = DSM 14728 TaxID=1121451 RepID=L0R820_9BACT|nr:Nucleoside recognition domain protein [Maridesulfovibrio hydrothermalis]CCO22888.1 Nucleoside recognition domain protein [Maridesulfovibrio hydrothermalis AM13 = DSM 14728]
MSLSPEILWSGLGWPLIRLILFISLGLFVGNIVEGLRWTRAMGKVATPLIRAGRLKDISGASFALAFFSGVAANSMLSEAYEKGEISDRELVVSNLFNSLPTYFLHMPTVFFIAAPFIGSVAFIYVGLTLLAAFVRTAAIVLWGRFALPEDKVCGNVLSKLKEQESKSFSEILAKALKRLKKRLPRVIYITIPIYIVFFFLRQYGYFEAFQAYLSDHLTFLSWLNPKIFGVIAFSIAAEFTAGLAAAGALLGAGTLEPREIVLALMVGNILSTPMRAVRHQLPYYAGIFRGKMAIKLIIYNQGLRAVSLMLVGAVYFVVTM